MGMTIFTAQALLPVMRFSVVINSKAGTARRLGRPALTALFKESLDSSLASCRFVSPRGLRAACLAAFADRPDVLVIVGGDGSARTATELAVENKLPIAALPGGTMNVLPKRLSGTLTLEECLGALSRGAFESARVDCGFANERLFLVGAAFGMLPELARLREDFRLTRGVRDAAKLSARLVKTMPRLMRPTVVCRTNEREVRVPALIASVDRVDHWGTAPDSPGPTDPTFDCVALCAERWRQVAGVMAKVAWGGDWRGHSCIEGFSASRLSVQSGRHTRLTLDGEPLRLPSPVRVRYGRGRVQMIVFPEGFSKADDASDRSSLRPALSA
jgi:diacylglycerol kinase family enzyme